MILSCHMPPVSLSMHGATLATALGDFAPSGPIMSHPSPPPPPRQFAMGLPLLAVVFVFVPNFSFNIVILAISFYEINR